MYSAYLFHLDGMIYLGHTLLPRVAEIGALLWAASRRTIFLSNTPSRTRQQYAMELTALNIPTSAKHIMNASFVLVP